MLYETRESDDVIQVGDYVKVRNTVMEPVLGWDGINHDCVGIIRAIHHAPGSDLASAIVFSRSEKVGKVLSMT